MGEVAKANILFVNCSLDVFGFNIPEGADGAQHKFFA